MTATHPFRRRASVWLAAGVATVLLAGCGDASPEAASPDEANPSAPEVEEVDEPVTDEPDPTGEATDEPQEATEEPPESAPVTEVELRDDDGFVFAPAEISVAVGETVTWVHEGRITHTVTADGDGFDSGPISAGDTFEVTFEEAGTYPYVCDFHGSMTGTVSVS